MTQPLFFEPDVQFEKTSGSEVMLGEDPNAWPGEIVQELFKTVPYISDFEPQVIMDKTDGERGYAFGHVEVQNKTEIQHGAPTDAMQSAGIKNARIPIIIKDRKLQPLDLLVTDGSEILPLTESRLRGAIFRPQAFDITGRGPGDMSMIGQLYPPYRQNYGFGGGGATMNVGMGKESSVEPPKDIDSWHSYDNSSLPKGHRLLVHPSIAKEFEALSDTARIDFIKKHSGSKALIGVKHGYTPDYSIEGKGKESADKEALNMSTIGSYLKKQTNPQGLASASKSLLGRGAQQVAGGAAAAGQKTLLAGNIAAQRATKMASLLELIQPTLRSRDVEDFFRKISNDRGLEAQLVLHAAFTKEAIEAIAGYKPIPQQKRAAAMIGQIKPNVVQLRKEAEGYSLKTASHGFWLPETRTMNRGEAVQLLGDKVVLAADTTGAATMALGEGAAAGAPEAELEGDKPELITQFGIYKVQDESGRHLIGYVFPNLIDVDGTALPIALFTNGSQMAVQGEIVGINVGGGASLFEGEPHGMGCFYHVIENGRAEATVPMNIQASVAAPEQGEGGAILHGETFDGRPVQISVQPNIEEPMPSPDGDHLIIPDTFSWLPLDKAEDTALVGNPEEYNTEAEAASKLSSVTVRGDGSTFSVSGLPVEKLATDECTFLSLDETLFLLGGLGTDLDYAQIKLGQAVAFSRPIDVRVAHYIKTARDRMNETIVESAKKLAGVQVDHLRADLLKEAAVIPDPVAVDTVLSLGFLNPENLGMFISYLPMIDQSQKKMCELLLSARLGLREIPVPALEKAIRTTEEAIEGLKVLGFQQS